MGTGNVISMVDDFNVKATIHQISEFEHLLHKATYVPRWKYIIVDEISGRYVYHHVHHGISLARMDEEFIDAIKFNEAPLYDLEKAKEICKELNEAPTEEQDRKIQFVPILWRRYCIIHLATLYDVIQKMDAKGKTKGFFSLC